MFEEIFNELEEMLGGEDLMHNIQHLDEAMARYKSEHPDLSKEDEIQKQVGVFAHHVSPILIATAFTTIQPAYSLHGDRFKAAGLARNNTLYSIIFKVFDDTLGDPTLATDSAHLLGQLQKTIEERHEIEDSYVKKKRIRVSMKADDPRSGRIDELSASLDADRPVDEDDPRLVELMDLIKDCSTEVSEDFDIDSFMAGIMFAGKLFLGDKNPLSDEDDDETDDMFEDIFNGFLNQHDCATCDESGKGCKIEKLKILRDSLKK